MAFWLGAAPIDVVPSASRPMNIVPLRLNAPQMSVEAPARRRDPRRRAARTTTRRTFVMSTYRMITLVAALVLSLTAAASATELWAGPVQGGSIQAGNRFVGCAISNTGDKGIDVTIEMFDPNGNRVGGPADFGVFPHGSAAFNLNVDGRLCRFSGNFSRSKVRATASTLELIAGQLSTTASVPAN